MYEKCIGIMYMKHNRVEELPSKKTELCGEEGGGGNTPKKKKKSGALYVVCYGGM